MPSTNNILAITLYILLSLNSAANITLIALPILLTLRVL
jgi:hypothetical protein